MKLKRFIGIVLVCLSAILILSGCGDKAEKKAGEKFVIELYPEYAPKTVENFIKLVEDGFYDGLTFHRIVDNFMAQGGGYDPDGKKIEADSIDGEFALNGYTDNTLNHTKGIISMARADTTQYGDPIPGYNSASSEFFIMLDDSQGPYLDGKYAAFGKVTEGMEVIDKLQEVERTLGFDNAISAPVNPVIIKKATVLEKGDHPRIEMELEPVKK